jgi:cell division septation protein DedD
MRVWSGRSKLDVAGYLARRLAMANDTNERIAVASAAIDVIGAWSSGHRHLSDIDCDCVVPAEPVFAPVPPVPANVWRSNDDLRRASRNDCLKMAGLALLAMAVVLMAGVLALTAQGSRAITTPQTPTVPAAARPAATTESQQAAASADMWVVQVGAFSNRDRSQSLVQRLKNSGFPTFAISRATPNGRLNVVRVGPFRAASEADDARGRLRELVEFKNAFVRNVTSIP